MKAVRITEYGDSSVVKVERDAPAPQAGPGRVLVKVHAASLNPVDSAVRSGAMKQMVPLELPVTLGSDIAGVVTEVGAGVNSVRVGDRVFGTASALAGASGAFAELASVGAGQIAKIPEGLSFVEAAAIPLAGVSALQALETMGLRSGQKLLVHGGSGGIGAFAIQLARAWGAHVATTVRGSAVAFAKSLGAEVVIDFEKEPFQKVLRDYDAVLDTVGGEALRLSFDVVRKGGSILSMRQSPDAALAAERGIKAAALMTQVTTERLERLAPLVADGRIKVPVQRTFPLDQVREAFAERERGGVRGKLVLQIA